MGRTLPTRRSWAPCGPTGISSRAVAVLDTSVAGARTAALVGLVGVVIVALGAGRADRIPARNPHALGVPGGGVAAVVVEEVAVVGHLVGDLPGGDAERG